MNKTNTKIPLWEQKIMEILKQEGRPIQDLDFIKSDIINCLGNKLLESKLFSYLLQILIFIIGLFVGTLI